MSLKRNLTLSQISIKSKALALAISPLLYPNYSLAVTCNSGTCTINDNTFSEILVSGTDTQAQFIAPTVTVQEPYNGKNINVTDNGSAHFKGDLNIEMTAPNQEIGRWTALDISSGGKIAIDGNFRVVGSQVDSAPGLIQMTDGTLNIAGDAAITTLAGSNAGSAMFLAGDSVVNVAGKTTINHLTASGSTMALSVQGQSKASFNELEVNANNHMTIAAGGTATISSTGKTTITNNSAAGDGVWFIGQSLISLGENASVTAAMEANRTGVAQLNIGKDASIKVKGG